MIGTDFGPQGCQRGLLTTTELRPHRIIFHPELGGDLNIVTTFEPQAEHVNKRSESRVTVAPSLGHSLSRMSARFGR